MRFAATFALLAASCLGTVGCALMGARTPPPPAPTATLPRQSPSTAVDDEPISIAQTNVVLPTPQPIQADALGAAPPEVTRAPEPSSQTAKPRVPAAPRAEPRQQTSVTAPQGPPPPPVNPAGSRRRIRPVESAAERHRLLTEISTRQRQVQDILAKAKTRQLSEQEKAAAERIQAFLDQTEGALKDQDLQQAEALSSRALLLCQELNSGK